MTEEEMAEEYVKNIPFSFETEAAQRIVKMYAKEIFWCEIPKCTEG